MKENHETKAGNVLTKDVNPVFSWEDLWNWYCECFARLIPEKLALSVPIKNEK